MASRTELPCLTRGSSAGPGSVESAAPWSGSIRRPRSPGTGGRPRYSSATSFPSAGLIESGQHLGVDPLVEARIIGNTGKDDLVGACFLVAAQDADDVLSVPDRHILLPLILRQVRGK